MDRQEDNGLIRHREPVQSAWIDYNGHMNVAYYVLAFDHATDVVLDALGLGAAYADTSGMSIFVADKHVAYRREVHEGDMLRFESRLLDFDDKCLHIFHTMLGGKSMEVAATNEIMCVHVDLGSRRPAALPPAQKTAVEALWKAQSDLDVPAGVGRVIKSLR